MLKPLLNLGVQPIANEYINEEHDPELFFKLVLGIDEDTMLLSLMQNIPKEIVYTSSYAYHSSGSKTMRDHFRQTALDMQLFDPELTLEIGSNDGAFLSHFPTDAAVSVEPCGNFAMMTRQLGYRTFEAFWNVGTAQRVVAERGQAQLVYSANCICHIEDLDETFQAVNVAMADDGVFVFEDPSVEGMIKNTSYDQVYVEHVHMFSATALDRVLRANGLEIFDIERLSVHGGSNRIFAKKMKNKAIDVSTRLGSVLAHESEMGLDDVKTYYDFAASSVKSKKILVEHLKMMKALNKKIISYGATAKSATVFNYCKIGPEMIDYITDNTPAKQDKLSPGVHIPIVSQGETIADDVDVAFLGAWNYLAEIAEKEKTFLDRGGVFLTHVPNVRLINKENVAQAIEDLNAFS